MEQLHAEEACPCPSPGGWGLPGSAAGAPSSVDMVDTVPVLVVGFDTIHHWLRSWHKFHVALEKRHCNNLKEAHLNQGQGLLQG